MLNDFHKPPELGTWFAIVILVRNSVLYYSNEYNGLTVCKIRQLKTLGYEPILVRIVFYRVINHKNLVLGNVTVSKIGILFNALYD